MARRVIHVALNGVTGRMGYQQLAELAMLSSAEGRRVEVPK